MCWNLISQSALSCWSMLHVYNESASLQHFETACLMTWDCATLPFLLSSCTRLISSQSEPTLSHVAPSFLCKKKKRWIVQEISPRGGWRTGASGGCWMANCCLSSSCVNTFPGLLQRIFRIIAVYIRVKLPRLLRGLLMENEACRSFMGK